MVSLVLFAIIGKRLQVPRHSVHLVWGNVVVVGDPAIGGCSMVDVLYTILTVNARLVDWDIDYRLGLAHGICLSCGDPCEKGKFCPWQWDWDAYCQWHWDAPAKPWNCNACGPQTLCPECHIHLPDGCSGCGKWHPKPPDGCWRCFRCLEELDGLDIARTTLKRFELCYPERLHALRAVFHWKQLWLTFAKGRVSPQPLSLAIGSHWQACILAGKVERARRQRKK